MISKNSYNLALLFHISNGPILKEQYPVTAHAPNFDFWTECREIKRCEESKRTVKNPFASRLTGLNTTLKLLRITDRFGQNLDFWRYFYCRWPEDQKIGSTLMPIEGLFLQLASIQAQIIMKGIHSNNKDCKKETIETLM